MRDGSRGRQRVEQGNSRESGKLGFGGRGLESRLLLFTTSRRFCPSSAFTEAW